MSAAPRSSILHLTAELWPYARTGGLGQAVADIATEQARIGLDVSVLLPLYRVARERATELERVGEPFTIEFGGGSEQVACWQEPRREGAPRVLFLDHPRLFDRPGIYGDKSGDYPDNDRRFALFALGAIEVARRVIGDPRMVLHAHDWHTALTTVYLRVKHADQPDLTRIATVVTVHNGGFQGLFGRDTLAAIGLPDSLWSIACMEWYGRLNYLKGGLLFADMVTTVSPTHASELRTEVGGFGLHQVFLDLGDRLVGIRNGIETLLWNPATDLEITAHYTADDLAGKAKCKASLQRAWTLPQRARTPVFGMSARLVTQKGLDLIVGSRSIREGDTQFLFLGEGEARFEEALRQAAAEQPERVAVNTAFTDRLEHRLLAGADFLLMPSLYEPCGLTQMRAQHYGALPLARAVGGLADTIADGATGFLFDGYTPDEFDRAVRRALAVYHDENAFAEHQRAAMRQDFSWKGPIAQYADVYRRARARH